MRSTYAGILLVYEYVLICVGNTVTDFAMPVHSRNFPLVRIKSGRCNILLRDYEHFVYGAGAPLCEIILRLCRLLVTICST